MQKKYRGSTFTIYRQLFSDSKTSVYTIRLTKPYEAKSLTKAIRSHTTPYEALRSLTNPEALRSLTNPKALRKPYEASRSLTKPKALRKPYDVNSQHWQHILLLHRMHASYNANHRAFHVIKSIHHGQPCQLSQIYQSGGRRKNN